MKSYEIQEAMGKLAVNQYVPLRSVFPDKKDWARGNAVIHQMECADNDGKISGKNTRLVHRKFGAGQSCIDSDCHFTQSGSEGCVLQNPAVRRKFLRERMKNQAETKSASIPSPEVPEQPRSGQRHSRLAPSPIQIPLDGQSAA